MDPIALLRSNFDSFTKSEQKLARYLLDSPASILSNSIDYIAKAAGSSNAAMVRLCQKLGFKGYSEFRFSMHRSLITHAADDLDSADKLSPMQGLLNIYTSYINQLPQFVNEQELQKAARVICNAKRIAIWGSNRTFLSAQQLSHRLRRMGIFNAASDDWVVLRDDTEILGTGDCFIFFSMKGRGLRQYASYVGNLIARGCYVILVTMDPKIPSAKDATQVFTLPCPSRDPSANFLEDQVVTFLFIELLLYEVGKCYQG